MSAAEGMRHCRDALASCIETEPRLAKHREMLAGCFTSLPPTALDVLVLKLMSDATAAIEGLPPGEAEEAWRAAMRTMADELDAYAAGGAVGPVAELFAAALGALQLMPGPAGEELRAEMKRAQRNVERVRLLLTPEGRAELDKGAKVALRELTAAVRRGDLDGQRAALEAFQAKVQALAKVVDLSGLDAGAGGAPS